MTQPQCEIESDPSPSAPSPPQTAPQTYRIGAVARLTGIPPDTLRVWERRYAVVTPFRSDAGTRLYGADDVARLTLIKRLVDQGDAISHVAGLPLVALRERVRGLGPRPAEAAPAPCRVGVLGPTLPALLALEQGDGDDAAWQSPEQPRVQFVGLYQDEMQFRAEAPGQALDVVLMECPTIHPDQVHRITDLLACCGAPRAVVVYNFATRSVLDRLEAQRVVARRAPVDASELRRWCALAHAAAEAPLPVDLLDVMDLSAPPPRRRYDSAALNRIAAASPAVRCECPHHLVQLVSALVAFETYSQECESRNADDAALHAFLHAATAHARATMEAALARVVEVEGIEV